VINTPLAAPLGGPGEYEAELAALLDAYAPGWDASPETQSYAEARVLALAVAFVWAVNRRASGRMVPGRMLETLTTWEEACNLRPLPGTSLAARRAAVAARFLGFAGNAYAQIYDVCAALAGSTFLGLAAAVAPTHYEPGVNPGPPGMEWSTQRATLAVRLSRNGLPDAAFLDLVRRLRLELHALLPAWMTVAIGTSEGGCVAGVAVAGLTLTEP
jgi:hypothetical protein